MASRPRTSSPDAAATRLAAKLKTPLPIGQHLVRAFELGFEVGAKPIDENVVEAVLSPQIDDLTSPVPERRHVRTHQSRVARHISGKDRGETAGRGHG